MSKTGTIKLKGCSGKIYDFEVFPFGTNFNALGAIYFISKEDSNNHEQIYLGITDDLSTRFNGHHKQYCFNKHRANCISVHLNESKAERESIEKDILCYYDFPCNDVNN